MRDIRWFYAIYSSRRLVMGREFLLGRGLGERLHHARIRFGGIWPMRPPFIVVGIRRVCAEHPHMRPGD